MSACDGEKDCKCPDCDPDLIGPTIGEVLEEAILIIRKASVRLKHPHPRCEDCLKCMATEFLKRLGRERT